MNGFSPLILLVILVLSLSIEGIPAEDVSSAPPTNLDNQLVHNISLTSAGLVNAQSSLSVTCSVQETIRYDVRYGAACCRGIGLASTEIQFTRATVKSISLYKKEKHKFSPQILAATLSVQVDSSTCKGVDQGEVGSMASGRLTVDTNLLGAIVTGGRQHNTIYDYWGRIHHNTTNDQIAFEWDRPTAEVVGSYQCSVEFVKCSCSGKAGWGGFAGTCHVMDTFTLSKTVSVGISSPSVG